MTITPWQECCEMIRSFDRRKKSTSKRKGPKQVLEGQQDQVEFVEKGEHALYSGTVAKDCLFEYLADDKQEVDDRQKFCILDEDDEDDEDDEEKWTPNWSGRIAVADSRKT